MMGFKMNCYKATLYIKAIMLNLNEDTHLFIWIFKYPTIQLLQWYDSATSILACFKGGDYKVNFKKS